METTNEKKAGIHYIRINSDQVFAMFNDFKKAAGIDSDAAITQLLDGADVKNIRIAALKKQLAELESLVWH